MHIAMDEPNSTPKLTLSKLPCKPKQPPQILKTPPFQPPLSIPFQWEEEPGKPRSPFKNKVARCLELPPRLDAKITTMPSPTTVLDGPYVGRSLSLACTLSFRRGPVITGRDDWKRGGRKFGSRRWEGFDEEGKGSFDFSHTLGDAFRSEKNVNVTRVGRKRSFFSLSSKNNSNLWADIYSSFKQAVPWRRRRSR